MPKSYSWLVCETDNFVTQVQILSLAPEWVSKSPKGTGPITESSFRFENSKHGRKIRCYLASQVWNPHPIHQKKGMVIMTFELKDNELEKVTGGTIIPYLIEAGDTLAMIAKKFNCTVEELQRWNKIEDADKIDVGQKLIIKF